MHLDNPTWRRTNRPSIRGKPIVSFPHQTTNHQKMPEIKLDQSAYECIKSSHAGRGADLSTKESASRKIPHQAKNHVENAHFPKRTSGTNH